MKKGKTCLGIVLPDYPTLEEYPREQSVAWTVSLPDKVVIPMSKINPKPPTGVTKHGHPKSLPPGMHWKNMDPWMQMNYIKYEYLPELFKYCQIEYYHVYFELNKKGRVHAHAVIYSESPDWDAHVFRAKCRHHATAVCIHLGRNEAKLNFIHTITDPDVGDPEWVDYIYKGYFKNPFMGLISRRTIENGKVSSSN